MFIPFMVASSILAAPSFPPTPELAWATDFEWCVIDTLNDGTPLSVVGDWSDAGRSLFGLAMDDGEPKGGVVGLCVANAQAACGQDKDGLWRICSVTFTGGGVCSFVCWDSHGNCPSVIPPTMPPSVPN